MAHPPMLPDPVAQTRTAGEVFPEDLEDAILELKRERNAVLLAHYYQEDAIQDLADFVGDSLALAQAARASARESPTKSARSWTSDSW